MRTRAKVALTAAAVVVVAGVVVAVGSQTTWWQCRGTEDVTEAAGKAWTPAASYDVPASARDLHEALLEQPQVAEFVGALDVTGSPGPHLDVAEELTVVARGLGGSSDDAVLAFRDGTPTWARTLPDGELREVVDGQYVAGLRYESDGPRMMALGAADGAVVDCVDLGQQEKPGLSTYVTAAVADGSTVVAHLASGDGDRVRLSSVAPGATEVRWEASAEHLMSAKQLTVVGDTGIASPLEWTVVSGETDVLNIFASRQGGYVSLEAFDTTSGSTRWSWPADPAAGPPRVARIIGAAGPQADATLLVATHERADIDEPGRWAVLGLDPHTGDERWRLDDTRVDDDAVVADGILLLTDEWDMVAVDASTGQRLWEVPRKPRRGWTSLAGNLVSAFGASHLLAVDRADGVWTVERSTGRTRELARGEEGHAVRVVASERWLTVTHDGYLSPEKYVLPYRLR